VSPARRKPGEAVLSGLLLVWISSFRTWGDQPAASLAPYLPLVNSQHRREESV